MSSAKDNAPSELQIVTSDLLRLPQIILREDFEAAALRDEISLMRIASPPAALEQTSEQGREIPGTI